MFYTFDIRSPIRVLFCNLFLKMWKKCLQSGLSREGWSGYNKHICFSFLPLISIVSVVLDTSEIPQKKKKKKKKNPKNLNTSKNCFYNRVMHSKGAGRKTMIRQTALSVKVYTVCKDLSVRKLTIIKVWHFVAILLHSHCTECFCFFVFL